MYQTILWSELGLFEWTGFCLTWLVGSFVHFDAIWNWNNVYICTGILNSQALYKY